MLRRDRTLRRGVGFLRDDRPVRVQADRLRLMLRQIGQQPLLRQQQRNLRVAEHEGDALFRIGRINRQIRAARFQNSDNADQHL